MKCLSKSGLCSTGPQSRASLRSLNVRLCIPSHWTLLESDFLVRSVRGAAREAKLGMKRLYHPASPRKERTSLLVCGFGQSQMTSTLSFLGRINPPPKNMPQVPHLSLCKGTPYHLQTHGLVKRCNRTLKSMVRKFVAANGKDWDQWLPYLLFAYQEVPQASTGFSPFELLYGRRVRGPLDLLQEAWEQPRLAEGSSVISYVLKMRDKMEKKAGLVKDKLERAQQVQAQWYDRAARQRTLQPGQKVHLLLPTMENKLLARWQGPYQVCRRLGPVTYEIEMPERRKAKQTFHVNLLKEWHERDQPPSHQLLVRAVVDEDEAVEQFFPARVEFGELDFSHLTPQRQQELQAIIPEGLFQDQPGHTTLVEHNIVLKDPTPVRQRMYQLPER